MVSHGLLSLVPLFSATGGEGVGYSLWSRPPSLPLSPSLYPSPIRPSSHVMEHESFESEETAQLLNDYYVPVKVDREERPDVDRVYVSAPLAPCCPAAAVATRLPQHPSLHAS